MSAHTPGPWFVVEIGSNGKWPNGCEAVIDDREGGNEERDYFLASAVHGDPDELAANARLIAAAPELLEVCQAVMREFNAYKAEANFDGEAASITACRAAIAKATGAQS